MLLYPELGFLCCPELPERKLSPPNFHQVTQLAPGLAEFYSQYTRSSLASGLSCARILLPEAARARKPSPPSCIRSHNSRPDLQSFTRKTPGLHSRQDFPAPGFCCPKLLERKLSPPSCIRSPLASGLCCARTFLRQVATRAGTSHQVGCQPHRQSY
jgi:hypothetical protein